MMKTFRDFKIVTIQVLALMVLSGPAALRGIGSEYTLVVPNGLDHLEGASANTVPSQAIGVPFKIQYLYPASDFEALARGQRTITGVAWRLDESWTMPLTIVSPHSEIRLSTTDAVHLSTTFADNVGADETIVYDAPTDPEYPLGGPPRDFASPILFETPFFYDQASGQSLLLEFRSVNGVETPHSVDAEATSGIVRSVYAFGDLGAASGTPLESVIVSRLIFVPEPSSTLLVLFAGVLGFLCIHVRRRGRADHVR